ncbi:MAG: hypothetical protein K0R73_96 [Candidatus Midichloriaceae bacterium]|jgi:hypothetical protein|nr:hypothetical protein [Candidatus Midichloriaceae bacterium]
MLETFFNKKQNLSEISIDSISIYEGQRSAALKFSPTLLFLAREKFNAQLAGELTKGLTNSKFSEFATGYAYLMANSSPGIDSSPGIGLILKNLLIKLHEKLGTPDLQEVAYMLHLVLQNPTLNIDELFTLEGIANSENKTCLEHVFQIWVNCDDAQSKLILSDIITHIIAINPNLSYVTPKIKRDCFYALLSIAACASTKRYVNTLSTLSFALILPAVIPQLFVCASAISAGYFTAMHQDNLYRSASIEGKVNIPATHFTGAFSNKYPIFMNSDSIIRRMEDIMRLEDTKPLTEYKYRDKYLERTFIIARYKRISIHAENLGFFQQMQLKTSLWQLSEAYDNLFSEDICLFNDDIAAAFDEVISNTFNASNFDKIVSEIMGSSKKVEDFLKIYELAEKGAIILNLPNMLVLCEAFNQICYSGYESFFKGKQPAKDSNLSFESFMQAITVAFILNNKDVAQPDELKALKNFSNICANNLNTVGFKPNSNALDKAWRQTLQNFDRLYENPIACSKKEEPEVLTSPKLKSDFGSQVASSLKELTISSLNGWAKENQVTLRRLNVGLRTCAFGCSVLLLTHPLIQPIFLAGTLGYSVDYYFRPQILSTKEFVKKLCSSGYDAANSVYSKAIS